MRCKAVAEVEEGMWGKLLTTTCPLPDYQPGSFFLCFQSFFVCFQFSFVCLFSVFLCLFVFSFCLFVFVSCHLCPHFHLWYFPALNQSCQILLKNGASVAIIFLTPRGRDFRKSDEKAPGLRCGNMRQWSRQNISHTTNIYTRCQVFMSN